MTVTSIHRHNYWRLARWTVTAVLLALPAVAMRFTAQVNWTAGDFVAAALLLGVPLLGYDVIAGRSNAAYRAGAALALVAVLLLVWINLAVGIVGDEDNPANLLYVGVLAVAGGGAIAAKLKARGLARTMFAAAAVQLLITAIAIASDLGAYGQIWPWGAIGVTALLTTLWLIAAALFGRAAHRSHPLRS